MTTPTPKANGALRTIGELSAETGLPHHVLRYWETRFPSLKPMQRAGNRRYYRPEDAALVRRIDRLLNHEGYTIRGVQKLLAAETEPAEVVAVAAPVEIDAGDAAAISEIEAALKAIRAMLAEALAADEPRSPVR
ncbi:MerR family transcriptional regulator [Sphingomonas sp. Leaf339]|uniref:MerR family transcriptional regulator n=1 Tax=Sphingomonas sp. Leaf339 TaxID=1736343 RepID=UPI0006FCDBB6|nr:MerR family transcriptional regulator [Sphingomonas sp. Leaf339]KQU61650.1 MerR family transcriptional regulator [Sphingomonas sp. Leaf339]